MAKEDSEDTMTSEFPLENNQYDKFAKSVIRNPKILFPLVRDFVNDLSDLSDDALESLLSNIKVEKVDKSIIVPATRSYVIPDNLFTIEKPHAHNEEKHVKIHLDVEMQNAFDYYVAVRNRAYIQLMEAKYSFDDDYDHRFYTIWVFLNPTNERKGKTIMMPGYPVDINTGNAL